MDILGRDSPLIVGLPSLETWVQPSAPKESKEIEVIRADTPKKDTQVKCKKSPNSEIDGLKEKKLNLRLK